MLYRYVHIFKKNQNHRQRKVAPEAKCGYLYPVHSAHFCKADGGEAQLEALLATAAHPCLHYWRGHLKLGRKIP